MFVQRLPFGRFIRLRVSPLILESSSGFTEIILLVPHHRDFNQSSLARDRWNKISSATASSRRVLFYPCLEQQDQVFRIRVLRRRFSTTLSSNSFEYRAFALLYFLRVQGFRSPVSSSSTGLSLSCIFVGVFRRRSCCSRRRDFFASMLLLGRVSFRCEIHEFLTVASLFPSLTCYSF